MNKLSIKRLGRDFEKQYGSIKLLKVAGSALTRLLVKKGICSEQELLESFVEEVERRKKK